MNEKELLERRSELRSKILTLDWDLKRSQLNSGKSLHLEECKKELAEIELKLAPQE